MTELVDVVQVGYGPVGQALALLLGSSGSTVTVLEKHTGLYSVSRAGTLDHEALRILQGLGAASELEPKLASMLQMDLIGADGDVLASVPTPGRSASGWSGSYTMYQPDLEDALDRRVRATPEIEVLTGWEVVRVEQHPDHVEVESRNRASGEHRIDRGRYLVGADGANSTVRAALGIEQTDLGYVGPWLVCDYEHQDPNIALPFHAAFVIDPARPLLAGRWLGRAHSRMEFMLLEGEDPADFESEERCWELSRPFGLVPETSRIVRHAVYRFRSLLADDWHVGRVVLVGDAAHVMPPFLGQGLCSGLRDAASLAWRLQLVLAGTADPTLLDTYVTERRALVEQTIRVSMTLGWLVSVTDPEDAAERDADLRDEGLPSPPPLSPIEDGVVYRTADGQVAPGTGALSLQAVVRSADRSGLLDDLTGSGWRILTRRPFDLAALTAAQQAVLQTLEASVVSISPAPGAAELLDVGMDYDAWFESLGAQAVVVRPDFVTYAVLAGLDELGPVVDRLGEVLALR